MNGGVWLADSDISDTLTELKDASGVITGWKYTTSNDGVELYDATGKLLSITNRAGHTQTLIYSDGTTGPNGGYVLDANYNQTSLPIPARLMSRVIDASGRALSFGYDISNRVVKMTDPAGGVYLYTYDTNNNLSIVTYPDGKTKTYLYGELAYTSGATLPNALTGIIDENLVRYATYRYDASGRAYDEDHGGPVDHYGINYDIPNVKTTVTDPLGTARTYNFTTILGVVKSTGTSQPGGSGCGPAASNLTYDPNGNTKTRTDFNNVTTWYDYDLSRNLETTRIEAYGTTDARTITTAWHPTFRLPTLITEPGRTTTHVYDPTSGNLLSKTLKDTASGKTRAWTYTYTTSADGTLANLLKTINGPRTDVSDISTYAYYPNGDLKTITNALGHVTQITQYDPHGKPLTIVDPNNLSTTLTYYPRGWLKSRTVGVETTSYDYDGVGQLTKVTPPDGRITQYHYDDAHRLVSIVDAEGNHIDYTLDNIGNRIAEKILTPTGTQVYTHTRNFDALNRLWHDIGAYNQTTAYTYDAQGNVKTIDAPRTDVADLTSYTYDPLGRLKTVLAPDSGLSQYGYDGLDQLTKVTDPNNHATSYTINALGDTTKTISPDTNTTNRSYDEAGNLKTETDARGITTSYTYDALNRVTKKQSSDAGTPVFTYFYDDNCVKGRLCYILRNGLFNLYFAYDAQGRVTYQLTQTLNNKWQGSQYAFDNGGRLSKVSYTSGREVNYSYDAYGRITQVSTTLGTVTTVLANGFQYPPFSAQASSMRFGNGKTVWRSLNQDYQLEYDFSGPRYKGFAYQEDGNIKTIFDIFGAQENLSYDATGRLLTATDTEPTSFGARAYTYDKTGNRKSETANGVTANYGYILTNNQLITTGGGAYRVPNAVGSYEFISGVGNMGYDGYGRLITAPNTVYEYNALGQRIRKTVNGANTYFHYDPEGKLLYEQDPAGNQLHYVYVNGQLLARIDNSTVYYYHTDHLGTPQMMTDATGKVVWQANYEPFGKVTLKVQTVVNNIRLPGQYWDQETGLHQNYFRDYDPSTGRYPQSDPIGLRGGINTYAYVGGNPVSRKDPFGLEGISVSGGVSGFVATLGGSSTSGVVFGNTGQTPNVCYQSVVCGRAGVGLAFLGSIQLGYTTGPLCSGQKIVNGVFAQGALGVGLGGAGSYRMSEDGGSPSLNSGNIGPQVGWGGAGGVEQCVVTLVCANDPPCCKQPGGCKKTCDIPMPQIGDIVAP